ncbi:GrpB family protein [Streptomyces sp. URMC 123]|uniref:GrpB family protein n=1 Tax=Streptomyces sp. URMC 123 TaxID=3423403 RepID=UPI003F1A71DE
MSDGTELIGGQEKRDIQVVAYDPAWPDAFERERRRIVAALGPVARRVDHVGSTAVPGLVAKPIIDIDLSVPDADDEGAYLGALEAAGYQLRVRQPGHRMVRTPDLGVHVHICAEGSDWERRHLLFRDWLRHDAADREAYGRHKRELARRDWPDMNAYAAAKGTLIAEITERAEAWARATGWAPGA